jgi:copper(I)-binding protein
MMFTLLLAVLLASGTGMAAAPTTPIHVHDAYSRPANDMGAVFLTIVNGGASADAVDDARSDVANATEVHETYDTPGGSGMRHIARLEIPAGTSVAFHTGGYHVMLIGLKRDLRAGEKFTIGLHFEHAGWIDVPVEVRGF